MSGNGLVGSGNGLVGPTSSVRHGFGVSPSMTFRYASMEEAFPEVDPEFEPFGSAVLIQIRQPLSRTAGGIQLPDEAKEAEHHNTQIGKVRAVGTLAFCNRDDGKRWPEGSWCQPGDFVRVPKYQGDRFFVEFKRVERPDGGDTVTTIEQCVFVIFKDLQLLGRHTGDPLKVKAYY